MNIIPEDVSKFTACISGYYAEHARTFPWRSTSNPYHVLVSEIMLQQTQVQRVQGKYEAFLAAFPTIEALADADLLMVLHSWQGLGYNRRAVNLQKTAREVVKSFGGALPKDMNGLMSLPGIGMSTAGALLAFAFGIPCPFVETNIRRVFIHFFFSEREKVKDSEILPLVELTLDKDNPRNWYYALMDYGTMLKDKVPNPNVKSAHYVRQTRFEGSDRQIRGRILKALVSRGSMNIEDLIRETGSDRIRLYKILSALTREGFLKQSGGKVSVA